MTETKHAPRLVAKRYDRQIIIYQGEPGAQTTAAILDAQSGYNGLDAVVSCVNERDRLRAALTECFEACKAMSDPEHAMFDRMPQRSEIWKQLADRARAALKGE